MIRLKKLFSPVDSLDAEKARAYMAEHPEGTYTILDVRQPWEYQQEHLPGARLIPLPQLADGAKTLDPEKPVIVHCAVGGRSRVAAQLLLYLRFAQRSKNAETKEVLFHLGDEEKAHLAALGRLLDERQT